MHAWDYAVLFAYSLVMIGIGILSALRVKEQEDFFMGGRSFGKLLQTFAAFGAGTGSSDPVNTGRTTFTSGMSGMWSVMYWLFVTPFYWITSVWYRRMRHLTLGDWFVERYESKAMGGGYCIFGLLFFMVYGSMLFSAIGKVAAPLMELETLTIAGHVFDIEYFLVPIIGVVVLLYGIAGGLRAAYYTDLVQGICIILLSVILIPYGLEALVLKFGDPNTQGITDGFRIMHEQLPKEYFSVIGSTESSEFPLHRIIAVVMINLVGIVVQPHFIATGGGSAKTETSARVGLVVGNFLKRFCTVGWVLTALIALALFSGNPELVADPDKTWGVASRELLGPGLTGLMLACLLAALMSSIDTYMIIGSALVVRNIYAAYVKPEATDKEYLRVGRITGVLIVGGAVVISLFMMDVFQQLQLTWVFGVLFAAPFWIGMYWRRATTTAAWTTVFYCALIFFIIPFLVPRLVPQLRTDPRFLATNDIVRTTTSRPAAPVDVNRRDAAIKLWEQGRQQAIDRVEKAVKEENQQELSEAQKTVEDFPKRLEPLQLGEHFTQVDTTGGQGIFWPGGVKPVDNWGNVIDNVNPQQVGEPRKINAHTTAATLRYEDGVTLQGFGNFKLDFLLYQCLGMDLTTKTNATLSTLELPPKIITPFLVMILVSLLTKPNSKEALDRYYTKMKTPVQPDPEADRVNLEEAFANTAQFESRKLFPGSNLEFQKPSSVDVIGFVVCFLACFGIIWLAVWMASVGA